MFYLIILMQLSAAVASWSVSYSPTLLCAFENSSVEFNCSFDFPYGYTLKTSRWFKPRADQNQDGSQDGMSVYHSNAAEIHKRYKNRTTYADRDRNCTLKLHSVSKKDIGRYFFRFETNYFRQYTGSGGINLNVAVLPYRVTVNTQQTNREIHEGDSVTLRCSTENCTPKQAPFAWFKNGHLLAQATHQVLSFSSVSHRDFGNYSCGLRNTDRTSANETLLDVRYSPKNVHIIIFPSGEIEERDSLTLKCQSNANPALTNYSWFKFSDTNISYVAQNAEYTIRSVAQMDAGHYFCVALNDVGSQNSTVIELKVKVHGRLHVYMLISTAVLLFGITVMLIIFSVKKRKKLVMLKKNEVYKNLRSPSKSEENFTNLTYADLILPPSSSDRPRYNSQEDMTVIYSNLKIKEETEKIAKQI